MEKILPIGTVVLLKGATKKIMITGYRCKGDEEDEKVFDYNGTIFPEGLMENVYCLFDNDEIEEVIYEGLKNEETENYIHKINDHITAGNYPVLDGSLDIGGTTHKGYRKPHKAPTNPMSADEMMRKYTVTKISGGQTELFDFSTLK